MQPTFPTGGNLQTAAAIAAAGGSVTREYPIAGAAVDPAARAVAATLKAAASGVASPGNRLGASVGSGPEALRLELAPFVRKNLDALIDGPSLILLREIGADVQREVDLVHYHASPICQQRAEQAVRGYANDPTAANLKKLKEERALTPQDSALIQARAIQRLDALLNARLPAIGVPVCSAAVDLMERHLAGLAADDVERHAAWDVSPVASALQLEIERLLAILKNELSTYQRNRAPGGGIMGVLQTILKIAAEAK